MNREIKFRVFNPQEKQMTNVRLCDYMGFHGIVYDRVGCNNSDNIWMQFTGLQDTNEVDIFEDDNVKGRYMVQRSLDPNAEPEIIHFEGVIKYAEGSYYVKADNGQCVFSFTYPDYEIEVFSNVHESVS